MSHEGNTQVKEASAEAWQEAIGATTTVTTEVLDGLISDLGDKRKAYDQAKAASTEMYKVMDEAERKVIEAMNQAGKRKYFVDGVGTVYFSEKLVVPTPKTIEQKTIFFAWIKNMYGETFLLDKQSVNHQTLQKIYNDAYDEATVKGGGAEFSVPGLEEPTAQVTLNFRKEK